MAIQSSDQIGSIIRNALVFNTRHWAGETMNSDSLLTSVEQLFLLLEKREIEYVLVGGIAYLHYVKGRNTEDLDMIMALSSLEKLPELKVESQDMYFIRGKYQNLSIDVLLTKNPLFRHVQENHTVLEKLFDRKIPIVTVEGLLLLKLYALPSLYRQGDFGRVGIYENDIATLVYEFDPDISGLKNELSDYVDDKDMKEITNILSEIQQRVKRFRNSSG